MKLRRDEEAVSAAIATVLLFAGVLAIISGMMVTITPVINEKHGSIERQAMAGQMTDLAEETVRISETGLPGDSAIIPIKPHSGELGWDYTRGGSWYSVSYTDGASLRLDDLLDLDDTARIRYPTGEISSACFSDLRASASANWHYRLPAISGTVLATPISTLQQPMSTIRVTYSGGEEQSVFDLAPGDILEKEVSDESWLTSDNPLKVLFLRGSSGATTVQPDLANPIDGTGQSWTIPYNAGDFKFYFTPTTELTKVEWNSDALGEATDFISSGSSAEYGYTSSESGVLTIQSSAPGRILMVWGDESGATVWPDIHGSGIGVEHLLPGVSGSILVENPSATSVAVEIGGLFNTVSPQSYTRISWPDESKMIESTGPVIVHWLTEDLPDRERSGSLELIPASDTGRSSGLAHSTATPVTAGDEALLIQAASPETSLTLLADLAANQTPFIELNSSVGSTITALSSSAGALLRTAVNNSDFINNAPYRMITVAGEDGLMEVDSDGNERCIPLGARASGWMQLTLPWEDLSHSSDVSLRQSWQDGSHPLGIAVSIYGPSGESPHATLASAWGAHLPRLNYQFESSVSNMEIGYRGGFVGTNHPEYQPEVLTLPPAREGPGPRLAVTIPLTMPENGVSNGNGDIEVKVELDQREQLVSVQAYEIRRGWDGPYGAAIAAESSQELSFSSDWLTFPGRIDLLDDYVGWVQLTHSSPEAVYHAAGEKIMFNLQLSQLTISTEVAS